MEPKEFDVVEWFAKNGVVGYKRRILALLEEQRYVEAAELRREAEDRYQDWVSDPLD